MFPIYGTIKKSCSSHHQGNKEHSISTIPALHRFFRCACMLEGSSSESAACEGSPSTKASHDASSDPGRSWRPQEGKRGSRCWKRWKTHGKNHGKAGKPMENPEKNGGFLQNWSTCWIFHVYVNVYSWILSKRFLSLQPQPSIVGSSHIQL